MSVDIFNDVERAEIEAVKIAMKTQLRILLADLPTETYQYFKDCIVTGGAFASLFHGETPNDWDVYLRDLSIASMFESYVAGSKEACALVKDVNPNYRVAVKIDGKVITENAITFKNDLQVITCNDRNARKTFDFIHCMPYFDMATQQLYISRAQYDAIKNKKLIKNPDHPLPISGKRTDKFVDRGWRF